MSRLWIKNGRVIDPAAGIDERRDVVIENGRSAAVAGSLDVFDGEVFDAEGMIVAPGFIDLRARLREPGLEHAETIQTGAAAAAAGGFVAVCCLPSTQPFNDSPTVTSFIVDRAEKTAVVRVLPIGGLTAGGEGMLMAEIGAMKAAGAIAVGDGDRTIMDAGVMRRCLSYAASFGLTVIAHCEDARLAADGDIHDGLQSARLGLRGIPSSAETVIVARDIILAESVGARLHLAHVSAARSTELTREAKRRGVRVTAETAAHHLALSVEDVVGYDSNYRIRPPLRDPSDREALIAAVVDGTIDAVVSDHAPHTGNVKMQEFENCPFGAAALETAAAVAYERLVRSGRTDLVRFIEVFSAGPARVLGRTEWGTLAPGSRGDVTIWDPERRWRFRAEESASKCRNTPFDGKEFVGGPAATIVEGKVVWRARS